MRNIIQRLAWRNLSIQAKTGLLFALQLVLIAALVALALVSLNTLRTQIGAASTQAVEARSLIQEIKLDIEELSRLEGRLLRSFDDRNFDPATTLIDDDYETVSSTISLEKIPRLQSLALSSATEAEARQLNAEIDTLLGHLEDNQDRFSTLFQVIRELTDRRSGAIPALSNLRGQLEIFTLVTDDTELTTRFDQLGVAESGLVDNPVEGLPALETAAQAYLDTYEDVVGPFDRNPDVEETIEAYIDQAGVVSDHFVQITLASAANDITLNFMRVSSSRLENLTDVQATRQLNVIESFQSTATTILFIGVALISIIGGVATFLFARDLSGRVTRLVRTTRGFEAGNLEIRAEVVGQDEFSQLAQSFNAMAVQLAGLVGGLEQRVAERTRDLTITGEIGQAVIEETDPRTLMENVVELIRERFGFYHAQVFIVDDEGKRANLIASTGSAGRELLARRHSLEVGSLSVIGQVTASGEAVVALDTDTSSVHRRNELLPDTRSEMAIPMRIGERVIGALDVQSVAPNAFDADDVAVFQTMADLLAVALDNARLFAQLEDTRGVLQTIEQRLTGQAWRAYQQERDPNAPIRYALLDGAVSTAGDTSSLLDNAIAQGRMVATGNGDDINFAVPIRVRGEIIGAFGFGGDQFSDLSEEDQTLIEAVVDRVGLALENLRLVEQTARRAEYEQLVNEITSKIVGSTDVSHILQTTVQELGRVLRAPQTSVQLRRTEMEE